MLLSEQDPNGGGRMSRASNISALSRTSGKPVSRAPSSEIPPALDRGVSSMLRTGTEMGNVGIGAQFDDLSGINNMQRPIRSRATSRMSTASSMSNASSRASRQLRHFPLSSSAPRQPMLHYGQQYVADTLSPTTMNAASSSPFNGRDNRDRDSHRSHSMTHTIQPPKYGLVSNRSLTSLRPQPAFRSSNSYNYPISSGGGLRPPGSYQRSVSPVLGDDTRLPPQGSQAYDDERLSFAGPLQGYNNPVRTYYNHPQQHAGQGQEHRGFSNRHNPGQMRAMNPSSQSTMSLGNRAVEDDGFPVYGGPDQLRQTQNLNNGHPISRKVLGNFIREPRSEDRRDDRRRGSDFRSEAPPLPVDHKHRIAVEQASLKRSAPASISSFNTNLRTDSDAPSSDMALPPTPKDGHLMEVHRSLDRTKVFKVANTNRIVITEEPSSAPSYGMNGQLERNEPEDPGAETIPVGFMDRTKTIAEQFSPTGAVLKSDPFLGQEAQPMSMEVVSPQLSNIDHIANDVAELPASPVARRITRNLILSGLEASTTDDIQSSIKSTSSSGQSLSPPRKPLTPSKRSLIPRPLTPRSSTLSKTNKSTHSDHLPVEKSFASDMLSRATPDPTDSRRNRGSILSETGSSVLDSSTLEFAVRHSIPTAKGGGFGNEPGVQAHVVTSIASPGHSTEDGMSDVLAGYQGTDSKNETDALVQGGMTKKDKSDGQEHTDVSTDQDMKLLPLALRSRSSHVQKSSDELSFKSCTDLPEAFLESASFQPRRNLDEDSSASAIDVAPQRDGPLKELDACSFATAASPIRATSVPPSRFPSSNLGNLVMSQSRATTEMPLSKPSSIILRKQPPVPHRESSFSIVANKLRTSSKQSMKQGSVSVSGSSSTLSTTHLPPVVPPRESSTSKEAQRVHAAVSFLMRPLPSRFVRPRKNFDQEDLPRSDETISTVRDSNQDTSGASSFNGVVSSPPPVVEVTTTSKVTSSKPKGVPAAKMRIITFDTPEACNLYKILGSSPIPVAQQKAFNSSDSAIIEPSSVYSIQDSSSSSHVDPADGVAATPEPNRRDSQTTTHIEWHRYASSATGGGAQQVPLRPPSGIGAHLDSSSLTPLTNIQEDTTTVLRLSGYRYPGPSRYLPDLKEESHEDSSLNTSASNLKSSSFRFPFGAPSGVRASGEDPVNFSRRSSMVSHRRSVIGSNVGSTLGLAHGLPSMRFSRMNLFDGLTDELGLRYSRSMEEVPNASQRLSRGSPLRPASAGDVTGLRLSLAELDEAQRSRLSRQLTAMMNLFAMHRARSPELMAEIERLTIPSVGRLTQRFSEFFPSLREYYQCGDPVEFPIEEEIKKHALDEIHEIHPTQKRSYARLRPMRGVSHMVVIEDDLYIEITSKEKGHGNPSRPEDRVTANSASEADSFADKSTYEDDVTSTPAHNKTAPLLELQVPSPVVLRPHSHTVGPQELRISGDSALSSRRSLRSIVSTPTATETRPWNSDKNYPWATSTNPAIDISLPCPPAAKHSPRPGPSHLRNRLSDTSTASSFSTAQTATASPFGSPSDSTAHASHHRFSAFGRNGDQSHAVGERYPTSALSPPTAIFRDHLSASDTSDDEHYDTTHKTRLSLRKRFSSTRKATFDNQTNTRAGRSKTKAQDLASPESTKPSTNSILQDCVDEAQAFTSSTTANRHTFRDAEGMRAVDYRKQRIIDRIKTWWHKGSHLIRQLSTRKQSTTTGATTA
ncbi:uncharacterized protein ALTATR162_LOCUS1541 [Alternaria atra]|uniref:Uncharacterized protein n=1 Tax=Alternaria atra TaxID=119953 RepID=A0A8J2MXT7_9PLEO|nr:uncharacterized protein ALTATR162_LOCUS1541 [Alternaria atra]CAG5144405.1 unnamed protein product [Alternaria atra]